MRIGIGNGNFINSKQFPIRIGISNFWDRYRQR